MEKTELNELMMKVREGNEQDYEILYQEFQPRLRQFIFEYVRDIDTAEDLAQDTFLRIWENKEKYSPNGKFVSWLYRIARNLSIDNTRKRKSRKEYTNQKELEEDLILSEEKTPAENLYDKEIVNYLEEKVLQLSKFQQAIIRGRFGEGKTLEEIAKEEGTTVDSTKASSYRANNKLRRILHSEGEYAA